MRHILGTGKMTWIALTLTFTYLLVYLLLVSLHYYVRHENRELSLLVHCSIPEQGSVNNGLQTKVACHLFL